ncbi:DUF4269 domain-containing protein [Sediminitomix flava]|uniref:Uncharacterized protein DUF4269 n=1 Tax=Sediminitomix flava TaxID=379075 RepID=A0A315YWZ7_SEDFL|nr:DUF4269 domain-containing protein [Sediminitomix flava]PWJ34096.1 uncharacterized protein DUF4269 [Sediminitomix flava]
MDINFEDINYLKAGNEKQKAVFNLLIDNDILGKLKKYQPILVGTIPINIDIESSDLDIICCFSDKDSFRKEIEGLFGDLPTFQIWENHKLSTLAVVSSFEIAGFEIEIFGQKNPTKQQNAYRHMIVEAKLIEEKGEEFRKKIIELKKQGYKTEPAFAKELGLEGNPYEALLQFED